MSRSPLDIASPLLPLAAIALAGLALAACSQATSTRSSRDERVTEVSGPGVPGNPAGSEQFRYRADVQSNDVPMTLPLDAAWARVSQAYAALKLPVTTIDSTRHLIGAQNAVVRNRLAGDRLSRWLSCGDTPIGMPRADSYVVYLTMLTEVRPVGSASAARTIVTAKAEPSDGTTSGVQCSSTGALEQRLREALGAP